MKKTNYINNMPYCRYCGKEVIESAEICPHCGSRLKEPPKRYYTASEAPRNELPKTPEGVVVNGEKSIALAIVVSLVVPGFGALYAGYTKEGIIELICSYLLACIIVGFVVWIVSIIRGYTLCKQNNDIWYAYLEEKQKESDLFCD